MMGVKTTQVFEEGAGNLAGFSLEGEKRHMIRTGAIARQLLQDRGQRENAFVAGTLHDIGMLVPAAVMPDRLNRAITDANNHEDSLYDAEKRLYGTTHAEIGAYLLGLWGMPDEVVEAVAHHHAPQQLGLKSFGVIGAVYVADHLARESEGAPYYAAPLDTDWLRELGVLNKLEHWREHSKTV